MKCRTEGVCVHIFSMNITNVFRPQPLHAAPFAQYLELVFALRTKWRTQHHQPQPSKHIPYICTPTVGIGSASAVIGTTCGGSSVGGSGVGGSEYMQCGKH